MTSLNAIYSVEIPPTPLDKGGGDSREDPPKALTPTKCVSPDPASVSILLEVPCYISDMQPPRQPESKRSKHLQKIRRTLSNDNFLHTIDRVDGLVAKLLSLIMLIVIGVTILDLIVFLVDQLTSNPFGLLDTTAIEVFGLFLNVLIALEILENITAYLRKHVVQVELVIVTSLIAVARKIIIFDFNKTSGIDLIGLGTAVFALAMSYWIVRRTNSKYRRK